MDDSTLPAHCMLDTQATNTHSEYIILIAPLLQQWLHERASMLLYKNLSRLDAYIFILGALAFLLNNCSNRTRLPFCLYTSHNSRTAALIAEHNQQDATFHNLFL